MNDWIMGFSQKLVADLLIAALLGYLYLRRRDERTVATGQPLCTGVECSTNPCRCPCEGCRYHCGDVPACRAESND